jgi:hypothetical protein
VSLPLLDLILVSPLLLDQVLLLVFIGTLSNVFGALLGFAGKVQGRGEALGGAYVSNSARH